MDARGKRLLIIAAIVILVFLGVSAYFIFFTGKTTPTQIVDVNGVLVPFDQGSSQIKDLPTVGDTIQTPIKDLINEPIPVSSRARLRKITSFPVSGFVSFMTNSVKKETVIDAKTQKEVEVSKPITIHNIRYNDQRTGHLFNGTIAEDSILNAKITKTDLPSAEELVLNNTGNVGFLRYETNKAISTFKLIVPQPTVLPIYCQYAVTTQLAVKSKGIEVENLQKYLNAKLNTKNKVDGVFGKTATDGVKRIQKVFEVPITGITDEATRTAIANECDAIRVKIQEEQDQPVELKGSLVDGYIRQMVKNNQDNSLFFLEKDGQKTKGFLQSFTSGTAVEVFNSSFNEWLPQFVNTNLITLTTYSSSLADGYMYGLNPTTKTFSKVLGPLPALTTSTSPDGLHVLVSYSENGALVTKIVNTANGYSLNLPFVTLSEKCSWYSNDIVYCGVPTSFPAGIYPDSWYKGTVSFSDSLWSYTISTTRAVQVAVPNESVDIFRMESFTTPGYLFFMNKNNYELWSYRISGQD